MSTFGTFVDALDPVRQVRLLTGDLDEDNQCFPDSDLRDFLDLNDGNVRRASADVLDAIATSETLVSKVIRTQDLQTDGAKVADSLRKRAAQLRAQADHEDADGDDWDGFDVVDTIPAGRRRPERTPQVWGL